MRSPVQSWVPLQESTAHRCAFLYIGIKPSMKACFQSGRNDNGQKWAKRTKAWWQLKWKPNRDSLNGFLGYHATGQKGLEGADRRLKHPASRYLEIKHLRIFRECFFYSWEHWGNTENWYGKLNRLFWKLQILQVFSPVFTVSAWKSMKFQTWTT